jgi:subtilisin-like proprotein convertase family protein
MSRKVYIGLGTVLLCLGAALWLGRAGERHTAAVLPEPVRSAAPQPAAPAAAAASNAPLPLLSASAAGSSPAVLPRRDWRACRLTNTALSARALARRDHALLLANAWIDTERPLTWTIPPSLHAPRDNGSYLVQARGPLDGAFRASLAAAGAQVIAYIPNNAYLVRLSEEGAAQLEGSVQAILPYEPYYKLDKSLLPLAVAGEPLAEGAQLKLTLFSDSAPATLPLVEQSGARILGEEPSPFGPVVTVQPGPGPWTDLAQLGGVELVELAHARVPANDLLRVRLSAASDSLTPTNYLGLTGTNILITLADSGVDASHPDLSNRVFGASFNITSDLSGHGTHVAGIIAGNGVKSPTVTNAVGSVTNLFGNSTNTQFRGLAPLAHLYALSLEDSDASLQEAAARTNSPVSNNSWNYGGSSSYDIAAASYDAAVRDALPEVSGSQPVLFVFSAGNAGSGDDGGLSGDPESVLSPGTAKNVITVGAIEQDRQVTNSDSDFSSPPYLPSTDSSNEVAGFSSRGNVGIGIEGDFGRFKPDLVSPGTMVISDRSPSWDTNSYYNPTNYHYEVFTNQTVEPGSLAPFSVFIPDNAVSLEIFVFTNSDSTSPLPDLPIYLRFDDNPTLSTFDLLATNDILLPPAYDLQQLTGSSLFYSVGNPTNIPLNFCVEAVIATTNDHPELQVLHAMNDQLGPWYRYESGTSMGAAGVSGLLGLLEEFYTARVGLTNSPALMKALLINGARPAGPLYDLQVQSQINYQGWGLPSLANSAPAALTNLNSAPNNLPLRFLDQSPTNVLATGQTETWTVTPSPGGQSQPLRITLVWTDPPGNPAAGVALVNDLDLVVTNLESGEVFYGNDIPAGGDYSQAWDTNQAPNIDFVNNVENVYLAPPLGSNYTVSVRAHRVNVNAVTANTNNVVQDFALVIASGDGGNGLSNSFTLGPSSLVSSNHTWPLVTITNGLPLFNQRVGANAQYYPTNGVTNQWNFYVYTNTTPFPNVAFVTFFPPELGVTRMGTGQEANPANATRPEADIDLYVSGNPALTNLDPAVLASADSSVGRGGTEKVLYSNSVPGQVYYLGVRSQDQEGANYALLGVATKEPFNQRNPDGSIPLTVLTAIPAPIPDGSPALPGQLTILALTTQPDAVRKVVVTNAFTHQNFGDLIGTLTHGSKFAVLNNHRAFDNGGTNEVFVYDDSGENDVPGARHSDGPGSLRTFVGDHASDGLWITTVVDDSLTQTGSVVLPFGITIEPSPATNGVVRTIPGNSAYFDFVDVPPGVTNLTITVNISSSTPTPVELLLRRGDFPTLSLFDKETQINPPGGSLSLTKYDSPPLNAGRYYFEVFNSSPTPVTVTIYKSLQYDLNPQAPYQFLSRGNEPIPDDAVSYSTNSVGIKSAVEAAQVGVRIDHPRVSDLVLTLVSPKGTRVLLAENRGGLSTNGYGSGYNLTNFAPVSAYGFPSTNLINTGTNQGSLLITYDFFSVPDTMHVYYGGVRIFDSGLLSGSGSFTVDYGPGTSTSVTIIMNEGGDPNQIEWDYTVTGLEREINYAVFSEDTNFATVPIKFATPPFGSTNFTTVSNVLVSTFDAATPGDYLVSATVDGWQVLSNQVSVVADPTNALSLSNFLALGNGRISRVLPTVTGRKYTLSYATRGPGIVSFWRAEGQGNDNVGANTAILTNVSFSAGEVGQAFQFNGSSSFGRIPASPSLNVGTGPGLSIDCWINPHDLSSNQALVEWNTGNNFGAHLWISQPTQFFGSGTGCVYANLIVAPFINAQRSLTSGAGILTTNKFQHVALTYDKRSGIAVLYCNGVAVATQNLGSFTPETTPDLYLGRRPSNDPTGPYNGLMDEVSVYNRALSASEIKAIYTDGSTGKFDPTAALPTSLAEAQVTISGVSTNIVFGANTNWQVTTVQFVAPQDNCVLEIDGIEPGMLLDNFTLTESVPVAYYYLPEESLAKVVGENAQGDWLLEVLDNRAGATNPPPTLVSWQLSLTLDTVVPYAIPLSHAIPQTNTVQPYTTQYYAVDVPAWAGFATNTLFNVSGGNVNLLFNQGTEPVAGNAGNLTLLANTGSGGVALLATNGTTPILQPGERYYLGVQNTGTTPVSFSIEVDFNITPLTNGIALTNSLAAIGLPRYYQYDVSTNAIAVAFELLQPNGNVELVASKGPPLPDQARFAYLSANPGTNNQLILVLTNSAPVSLSPGRWYLGVFNNDVNTVTYAIRATESGPPLVIPLTNGVPFNYTATPGALLTNFFEFTISPTNTNAAALFELYNLSGNADLTLQRGALPYAAPYFALSANPGTNSEQIVIRTNLLGTNINGFWFLGVPNNDPTNVTYTIRAVISTNGMLISGIPTNPRLTLLGPGGAGGLSLSWPSVSGESYEVETSSNLVNWSVVATITNAPAPLTTYTATNPATSTPYLFYRIVQIPVP